MKHFSYRIHDRDFVLNSIWEGSGDELHYNEIYARNSDFGARILSGIALASLSVANRMGETGWSEPRQAKFSFESVVKSGDHIDILSCCKQGEDALEVVVDGRRAMRIVFGQETPPTPERSATYQKSKGRPLTAGDRQAVDWWISSAFPQVKLAPPNIIPWPLLASAVSGLIGRMGIISVPHTLLVNRFNEWNFFRSVECGETLHAEIHEVIERDSVSKPGWGVWSSARVLVVSDTHNDIVGNSKWICMFKHGEDG